jgi:hypothetical protein
MLGVVGECNILGRTKLHLYGKGKGTCRANSHASSEKVQSDFIELFELWVCDHTSVELHNTNETVSRLDVRSCSARSR